MPDALVLDLDGTLVDSAPDLGRHTNRLLSEHGRAALDLATVTSFVGEGAGVLLSRAFAATGAPLDDDALAHVVARYGALYAAEPVVDTRLMAHVVEALDHVDVPLALCTNKPERVARAVLEALGLAGRFPVVVGGDTLPVRKPDPAPLRAAAAGLGLSPERVVLVGDSEVDCATAEAAGVPFWWFTGGYHRETPARFAWRFDGWAEFPRVPRGRS
jgi:phosphoglycolate phosphatase